MQNFRLIFILLAILLLPLIFGQHIPIQAKSFFLTTSLTLKTILLFFLPFVVFSFVFSCLLSLHSDNGVIKFIFTLIFCVLISNFAAIMLSYFIGSSTIPHITMSKISPVDAIAALKPLWSLFLPQLIKNEYALLAGFLAGMICSIYPNKFSTSLSASLSLSANFFLKKMFVPLLPLFIFGFILKLEHDQILKIALTIYGPVLLIIVGTQCSYITFLYLTAGVLSGKNGFTYLRNILPAAITGFSASSSAAALPVLIICTERNLGDPEMARTILPATINIHTIGSALAIPILTMATLVAFGHPLPIFSNFFIFAILWAISKFAVAGVPGGAIIVVVPLLEAYLGLTADMVGLLAAIYVLFDPFGTATNVSGNGAFAIYFAKLCNMIGVNKNRTFKLV